MNARFGISVKNWPRNVEKIDFEFLGWSVDVKKVWALKKVTLKWNGEFITLKKALPRFCVLGLELSVKMAYVWKKTYKIMWVKSGGFWI